MKRLLANLGILFILVSFLFSINGIIITIKKEFSLGGSTDNDNYLLVQVSDVKVDNQGNIYVLDSIRQRVQVYDRDQNYVATVGIPKFDSRNKNEWRSNLDKIKRGEIKEIKLEELFSPQKMFLKNMNVYILDLNKVVIYSKENRFLGGVYLKNMKARSIFINNNTELVIAGIMKGSNHFLHVFDESGEFQYSFGEYFNIPQKIESGIPNDVDQKEIAFPSNIYYSEKDNEFYCMNPFQYEIHIYRDRTLIKEIRLPSKDELIMPPQGLGRLVQGYPVYSISYLTPPALAKIDNHLYVFSANIIMPTKVVKNNLDIFKDFNLYGEHSIDIVSPPLTVDQEGSLFCVELGAESSKVVKYRTNIADFQ